MTLCLLERESKGCSDAFCTTYVNVLFMRFDNVLNDSQAKAGPADLAGSAFIRPVKPFKHAGKIFFLNAPPVVRYFYQYLVEEREDGDGCESTFFSVFYGIVCEVDQYLLDTFSIALNENSLLALTFIP